MVKKKILSYLNLHKSFGIEYCEAINFDKVLIGNYDLPSTIENLNNYVTHCNLCELSKVSKSKTLGFGDIQSDIYIVGIANNFQHSDTNTMLQMIIENILELNIEDIYLTNLIKCTVQSQKSINKNNIDLCKEYFIKQIDIIRPKYIITLGEAYDYLVENKSDNRLAYGSCYDYNGMNLIPMLDLEFVYKNPSYKEKFYQDFKKLKMIMGQI